MLTHGKRFLLTAALLSVTGAASAEYIFRFSTSVSLPDAPPRTSFSATPLSGPAPLDVRFEATVEDDSRERPTYRIAYGDGVEGTGLSYTYTTPGAYVAELIAVDSGGNSTLKQLTINVGNNPPVVSFSASPASGAAPLVTQFNLDITDDGGSVDYVIDYGDGTEGTDTEHTYAHPGSYTASVTATDRHGASTTRTATINVTNTAPIVSFSVSGSVGKAPADVSFSYSATDDSGITPTYQINYGDGSAPGTQLTHTYTKPGSYTASVTATDNLGAATTRTASFEVGNNAPVISSWGINGSIGKAPTEVTFNYAATDDSGKAPTRTIDYGDGSAPGASLTHLYERPGTYTATLTVTDDMGATASREITVEIENNPPTASFGLIGTVGRAPAEVRFSYNASDDSGEAPTYTIDYGDGTAPGTNLTHTYEKPGSYTAKLTVTDDQGASIERTVLVAVGNNPPVISTWAVNGTVGKAPAEVTFTYAATDDSGIAPTRSIDYGDGSTGTSLLHTYTKPGTYTATVTVTDDQGEKATRSVNVVVDNNAPTLNFGISGTVGKAPATVTFTYSASDDSGVAPTRLIDYGDGTTPGTSLTHTYAKPGNYVAKATATDNMGAKTEKTVSLTVGNNAPVISTWAIVGTVGKAPAEVTFTYAATDDSGIAPTRSIDYGDGTTPGTSLTHTYTKPGTYTATVTVTDDQGEKATRSVNVVVDNNAPTLNFGINGTVGKAPATVTFTYSASDDSGVAPTRLIDYGDGTTPGTSLTHTYAKPGNYVAKATATDNMGAKTEKTVSLTVGNNAPVISTWAIVGTVGKAPAEVTFTYAATDDSGIAPTRSIDYGDGSTGTSLLHAYTKPGTYTARVTATDDQGAASTRDVTVTVGNNPPVVTFGVKGSVGEAPALVEFNLTKSDDSGIEPTHSINYGDGTTGTELTHTYASAGRYTATVTVTDNQAATTTRTAVVDVSAPAVLSSISASAASITLGQSFTLSWSATGHTGVIVTSGANSGAPGSLLSGSSVSIKPTATGKYTYSVKARSALGVDTAARTVTVNVIAAPALTGASISPTSLTLGSSATLSWTSANAKDVVITGTSGSGAPSEAQTGNSVIVKPTSAGNHTYTLKARNSLNAQSAAQTVTLEVVGAPVLSSTSASAEIITLGDSFTLSWNATGHTGVTVTSTTGSGATSGLKTGSSLAITPSALGTYTYTVQAQNKLGTKSDTKTVNVQVVAAPTLSIHSHSHDDITLGGQHFVTLSATNHVGVMISGPAGSGAPAGLQNDRIYITPTATGSFTYTLKAVNAAGKESAVRTFTVTVYPPAVLGSVSASNSNITIGQSFTLSWTGSGYSRVEISGSDGSGAPQVDQTGNSVIITPTTTGSKTYNVTAYNALDEGTTTRQVIVNVGLFPKTCAKGANDEGPLVKVSLDPSGKPHMILAVFSGVIPEFTQVIALHYYQDQKAFNDALAGASIGVIQDTPYGNLKLTKGGNEIVSSNYKSYDLCYEGI